MRVPEPSTRLSKEVEFIGSLPLGPEWIACGMALSKKIFIAVKKSLSDSSGASFITAAFSDDALISQIIESNVLAVIGRLLHGFQQLHQKKPQFFSQNLALAIDQLESQSTQTLSAFFDELFDLILKLAFPQGADDLILPVNGMAASLIRSFIWKTLLENVKKEGKRYFDLFTAAPSREQFFYFLLLQLQKGMQGQKIGAFSKHSTFLDEEVEPLRKALSNFILRYLKSISLPLFQERQENILVFAQPVASKISPLLLQLCTQDFFLSFIQKEWKIGAPLPDFESAILDKIVVISRDKEGFIRIIATNLVTPTSAAGYKEHLHSEREAIKFLMKESAKSFSTEMVASAIVDKLQENDWLERFLGTWYLAMRSQAHAQLMVEFVRNLLRNITLTYYT